MNNKSLTTGTLRYPHSQTSESDGQKSTSDPESPHTRKKFHKKPKSSFPLVVFSLSGLIIAGVAFLTGFITTQRANVPHKYRNLKLVMPPPPTPNPLPPRILPSPIVSENSSPLPDASTSEELPEFINPPEELATPTPDTITTGSAETVPQN